MSQFRSTEFNWSSQRVKLGDYWLDIEAVLQGGLVLSKASFVKHLEDLKQTCNVIGRHLFNLGRISVNSANLNLNLCAM